MPDQFSPSPEYRWVGGRLVPWTPNPTDNTGDGVPGGTIDPTLVGLSVLNPILGVVEQVAADAFATRAVGTATSTSLLTRGDADVRYITPTDAGAVANAAATAASASKAEDAAVVKLTGVQSVAGVKTFVDAPKITVWADAETRTLRELHERTYIPDDIKLASQSDHYGLHKARDKAMAVGPDREGGVIQVLRRDYAVSQTLDFSAADNTSIQALGGTGAYAQEGTRFIQTGGAGTPLFSCKPALVGGAARATVGIKIKDIVFDAGGVGNRALDLWAIDGWNIEGVWAKGGTEVQILLGGMDGSNAANSRDAGHGTLMYRVVADARSQPASKGILLTADGPLSDCAYIEAHYLRALHVNGVGLDVRQADTNQFYSCLIQRDAGGTGGGVRVRGGAAPGNTAEAYNYDIEFYNLNVNGGDILVEDTGRAAHGIEFYNMVGTSGSSYPTFQGTSSGIVTDERGYSTRRFTNGRETYTDPAGDIRYDSTVTVRNAGVAAVTAAPAGLTVAAGRELNVGGTNIAGAWTTFTAAAPTSETGAFTTVSAAGKHLKSGRTVDLYIEIPIGSAGTATGFVDVVAPFPKQSATSYFPVLGGTSGSGKNLRAQFVNDSTIRITHYDNTTAIITGVTLYVDGRYEAAA